MNDRSAISSWLRMAVMSAAVLSVACDDASGQVSVTPVYRSQQCGDVPAGLSRIDGREALASLVNDSGVRGLDGDPVDSLPSVDFEQQLVLLVSEGQRSTAGFGIELQGEAASVEAATVELPVRFSTPDDGAVVAQVLTSPCLVLALEPGDYEHVVAGPYRLAL